MLTRHRHLQSQQQIGDRMLEQISTATPSSTIARSARAWR
jgi:hypothetical protein